MINDGFTQNTSDISSLNTALANKTPIGNYSTRTQIASGSMTTSTTYTLADDGLYYLEIQSFTSNSADLIITADLARIAHQYATYTYCACSVLQYFKAGTVIGFENSGDYSSKYDIRKYE